MSPLGYLLVRASRRGQRSSTVSGVASVFFAEHVEDDHGIGRETGGPSIYGNVDEARDILGVAPPAIEQLLRRVRATGRPRSRALTWRKP